MQAARTVLPANALPANAHSSARRTATARTVLPANALPANAHSSARRTATIVAAWWHRKSLPALHHVRHGVCHGNHAIESLVKAISEIQLELHLTLTRLRLRTQTCKSMHKKWPREAPPEAPPNFACWPGHGGVCASQRANQKMTRIRLERSREVKARQGWSNKCPE